MYETKNAEKRIASDQNMSLDESYISEDKSKNNFYRVHI